MTQVKSKFAMIHMIKANEIMTSNNEWRDTTLEYYMITSMYPHWSSWSSLTNIVINLLRSFSFFMINFKNLN